MRDFNHPDICWKDSIARHTESRRFLQTIDDNFQTQVTEEPTGRVVLVDIVLVNRGGLFGDVKAEASFSSRDLEMVEFRTLCGGSTVKSRMTTLDFKGLTLAFSRVRTLQGRGLQEIWLMFKYCFLQAQDQCTPTSKKSSNGSRRHTWMSKELLTKLK